MNRQRSILVIAGIALVVVIGGALTWYGLTRNQQTSTNGIVYTNSISGQKSTSFPQASSIKNDGDSGTPPLNEVSISGLDDFFSGTLTQDQGPPVLASLTQFIRAHVGAHGALASVQDSKVTKTSDNPATYTFTLVLPNSGAKYFATITIPASVSAAPQVTFGGAQ